jgi:hypothetical protein
VYAEHLASVQREIDERLAIWPAGNEALSREAMCAHRVADPDPVEGLHRIRRQAQARSDRLEPRSLLENNRVDAHSLQRETGGQPADSTADDDRFQRVCGKPRSTFDVAGSGQRDVTTFPRV